MTAAGWRESEETFGQPEPISTAERVRPESALVVKYVLSKRSSSAIPRPLMNGRQFLRSCVLILTGIRGHNPCEARTQ